MKGLYTFAIVVGFTSMAIATSLETDKMEAGSRFNEQKIETKMDNSNIAPVQMDIEFAEVKAAQYNAEAKDFSRLATKKPSALVANKGDGEKKDDKTKKKSGISRGSIVCGVALGVAAVAAAVSGSVVAGVVLGIGICLFTLYLCS